MVDTTFINIDVSVVDKDAVVVVEAVSVALFYCFI